MPETIDRISAGGHDTLEAAFTLELAAGLVHVLVLALQACHYARPGTRCGDPITNFFHIMV
jgi:hypothetical protein